MSDLIQPDGLPIGPEPAGSGARPADLGTPPEPTILEPKSEDELPQWARDAITKANKEAADYRGKLRSYEGVFDGMESDVRDGWLEYIKVANAASQGDEQAIESLREAGLWEEPSASAPQGEPSVGTSLDDIMAAVDQRFAERDSKQAEAANVGYLHSEARRLGYEPGTPDYDVLVTFANSMSDSFEGPNLLVAANEAMQSWKRSQFDAFMAGKQTDARQSPTFPTAGGGQPNMPVEPAHSRMELRERAAQRLMHGGS